METHHLIVLVLFFSLVFLEIVFTKFFSKKGQRKKDGIVEFFSFFQILFFAQPLAFFTAYSLTDFYLPSLGGVISEWSVISIIALLLIFDDMTQYWWHRICHSVPILYNLIGRIMIQSIYLYE